MHISDHYSGFPQKTLVMILNHERARCFFAHDHAFDEQKPITTSEDTLGDDLALRSFFGNLFSYMEKVISKKQAQEILICLPEIHRPIFQELIPKSLEKSLKKIVPKNLIAMEEKSIIRILFEG